MSFGVKIYQQQYKMKQHVKFNCRHINNTSAKDNVNEK